MPVNQLEKGLICDHTKEHTLEMYVSRVFITLTDTSKLHSNIGYSICWSGINVSALGVLMELEVSGRCHGSSLPISLLLDILASLTNINGILSNIGKAMLYGVDRKHTTCVLLMT